MSVYPEMYVLHIHAWCQPGKRSRALGTGVTKGGKQLCECWRLNPGSLSEKPVNNCAAFSAPHPFFLKCKQLLQQI